MRSRPALAALAAVSGAFAGCGAGSLPSPGRPASPVAATAAPAAPRPAQSGPAAPDGEGVSGRREATPAADMPLASSPGAVGMDAAALDSLDGLISRGLADGVAPGAALAIGRHGRLVRLRGYGRLDWDEPRPAVTDSTLYDLASLTKVVATTTAAMILVDEGRLDLDAPVARYFPDWQGQGEKAVVTVRHLLTHSAGLPAWLPLYRDPTLLRMTRASFTADHGGMVAKEWYFHRIGSLGLEYPPGTRTVYSDLGMIVLQAVIENITGEPLNRFVRERVFQPLGMSDTRFSPMQVAADRATLHGSGSGAAGAEAGAHDDGVAAAVDLVDLLRRTAPTERDSTGLLIRGFVHDENARAMGGVAGHAGLFSSARDLAVFAQMMLNGGSYDGRRIVSAATVRLFTEHQMQNSSRALGWDTPTPGSSAGDLFSARSYGHTGFTGTSIWIDPERDVFVVLLTNRVDPTRENKKHIPFRRAVHDAVQRAITDMPVAARASQR